MNRADCNSRLKSSLHVWTWIRSADALLQTPPWETILYYYFFYLIHYAGPVWLDSSVMSRLCHVTSRLHFVQLSAADGRLCFLFIYFLLSLLNKWACLFKEAVLRCSHSLLLADSASPPGVFSVISRMITLTQTPAWETNPDWAQVKLGKVKKRSESQSGSFFQCLGLVGEAKREL